MCAMPLCDCFASLSPVGKSQFVCQIVSKEGVDGLELMLQACRLRRGLKEAGQFVDVSGFSLKCMVCGQGLKGAHGAQEHAAATGHTNFAENDAK